MVRLKLLTGHYRLSGLFFYLFSIKLKIKKMLLTIFVSGALLCFFQIAAAYIFPEIILQDPVYEDPSKPAVKFPHILHAEDLSIDCLNCHHRFEAGKNVWRAGDEVPGCRSCHPYEKSAEEASLIRLKDGNAYHFLCRGCHEKQGAGPNENCGACHKVPR